MINIRRASESDIDTVARLWIEAAEWLRGRGYDQWQYPVKMYNIEAAVNARTCWVIEDQEDAIGTVTLDAVPDMTLWREDEDPHNALYLHRLVVCRKSAAQELGSAIVDWASRQAASAGKAWLRLDAWSSNTDLHRYYLSLGFRLVRIVEGPGVVSGVLFERSAGYTLGRGPVLSLRDAR